MMSKQIQTTDHKKDKSQKVQRYSEPQQGVKQALSAQSPFPLDIGVPANLQAQVSMLQNSRIPTLQRQMLVKKIGKTQGNFHLQQVMRQFNEKTSPSAVIQLEGEGEVATAPLGGGTYKIVPGDTLWGIAKTTYGSGSYWRAIYQANPGKAQDGGNLILVGAILNLPVIDVPVASTTESVAPDGGDVEAVAPYGMSTAFGSFMIYPNEFVGPLPTSERDAEEWPIRQADYDQLVVRLTEVKDGTSKLSVTGPEAFQTHVYLDLGWLMSSSVGQELIQEIQDADYTTTITESTSGNSESAETFEDGLETTDTPPKPGPGTNATVHYNPYRLFIKDGSLDWHHRPPAIGLAHEMIHAWTDIHGMSSRGTDVSGNPNYELQTVGLDAFQEARISENRFRAAFGLPLRPEY